MGIGSLNEIPNKKTLRGHFLIILLLILTIILNYEEDNPLAFRSVPLFYGTFVVSCNDTEKKLADKEKELQELRQLAELDKREMENQYAEFASQYGELKKSVKDDSLIAA